MDVPYVNCRQFPDLKKKTIHPLCGSRGYWAYDRSVPGPTWLPDTDLDKRPMAVRPRLPDRSGVHDNPGPGTYNVPTEAARNPDPRFTMKGPAEKDFGLAQAAEDTPGPGYYNPRRENGLPKWTIGEKTLHRAREKRQRLLGPGARTSKAGSSLVGPLRTHASTAFLRKSG
jgi:hypothetical protein